MSLPSAVASNMQQRKLQMWKKSSQIWSQNVSATLEAVDAGRRLKEGVDARLADGRERAIAWVARHVQLPESRVAKMIRCEIPRVWADEYSRICGWHDGWCAQQAEMHRAKAEELEARTLSRRTESECND
jgi:hypothetical protein